MIVKIITKDGWVMYDNFTKISKYIDDGAFKGLLPIRWVDEKKKTKSIFLACMYINGEEKLIETNYNTFICNDEGKTIDRI